MNDKVFFTTKEAAKYVGMAEQTLAGRRSKGLEPKFYKPSKKKVLYLKSDLDAWIIKSLKTSDL